MSLPVHCVALSIFLLVQATGPVLAEPLTNAALREFGGRVSVTAPPAVKVDDKNSKPGDLADGNVHSRLVVTESPYTITIELIEKLPITKLAFSHSDYATELAPEKIEISLDGGPAESHPLPLLRPEKRKPAWQEIPIGKEAKKIAITVLSNHRPGEKINWGGFGEIAVLTPTDLKSKLALTGHDENKPVFVHPPEAGKTPVQAARATMPPVAKPGEFPRLLFTPAELTAFRDQLQKSPKGKEVYDKFLQMADTYAGLSIAFPSIEETTANKADKAHNVLSYRVQTLGFAYGLTGDEKYIEPARKILLGYAERYEGYPQHGGRNKSDSSKIMFQRLSEAMWLIPLLEGYDYIGGKLSPEDQEKIATGLIRPAIAEIRRTTPEAEVATRDKKDPAWRTKTPPAAEFGKYPNWLLFYGAATMMSGALLEDRDMLDLAAADYRTAIATGIGADGMWGEGAIGYQLFAMGVLAPGFETAARQGIDLWNAQNGRVKQLFDSPLRYAYPDGTMPGINDSARARMGSWQSMVYDYGHLRYGEPAYAFVINSTPRQLHSSEGIYIPTRVYDPLPEPTAVQGGSTLFGSLGYAILRDDTKYALLDYGPHGGTHGHYDKLNLLLFANPEGQPGDEMGGEPNFNNYNSPLHPTWTVPTIAHNTMTVDERSQASTTGKLLIFEDAPGLKVMRAESAGSYPGVLLDRTVVTTKDLVVDLFTGRSNTEHTWDRTLRFNGPLTGNTAGPEPLGSGDGYQHIKVSKRQPAAEGWQGVWTTKPGPFHVTLAGVAGQEILQATGPNEDQLALARQKGTAARFAVAYQLEAWGNPVQTLKWLDTPAGVNACEVLQKDGSRLLVFLADGQSWEAAGWKSDARVLVVQTNQGKERLLIGGGTFAENGARKITLDAAGNALAEGPTGGALSVTQSWKP